MSPLCSCDELPSMVLTLATCNQKTKETKQGSGRKILNNVWGEVPPGEITAIIGPSGAGESFE